MNSIRIYPSNKGKYLRLKKFCSKILSVLSKLNVVPIAYGSLVYFYYTKDEKMTVNDIDMLVPEESLMKIVASLKKNKIRYKFLKKWHVLQIFEDDLKIELDSVDYWQKDLPKKYVRVNFDGLTLTCLTLNSLKKVYKKASEVSKDNPLGNLKKYAVLKNIKQ